MSICKKCYGYTLIELAIVLFIVALLLGGLLVPLATSVEQLEREHTIKTLQEIKESLYGFAVVNGRLPCPDCETGSVSCPSGTPDDGLEDLNGNDCSIQVGNLPWTTLNVPQFDGWGYVFTYRVTDDFSRENAAYSAVSPCSGSSISFDLCTLGTMFIFSQDNVVGSADIAEDVPAIVISHGKNHYSEVQSPEEVENYERNPTVFGTTTSILTSYSGDDNNYFVHKDYTLVNGEIDYDDIMIWISPFILKNKLVKVDKLP